MATKSKNTVDHRDRKNPRSRQAFREAKHVANAERGKQAYNFETKTWENR